MGDALKMFLLLLLLIFFYEWKVSLYFLEYCLFTNSNTCLRSQASSSSIRVYTLKKEKKSSAWDKVLVILVQIICRSILAAITDEYIARAYLSCSSLIVGSTEMFQCFYIFVGCMNRKLPVCLLLQAAWAENCRCVYFCRLPEQKTAGVSYFCRLPEQKTAGVFYICRLHEQKTAGVFYFYRLSEQRTAGAENCLCVNSCF